MKDTREEILITAFKHFLVQSYSEVTLEHLVKDLNLSKGAFYHHFTSKQELFVEVIDRFVLYYIEIEEVQFDISKTLIENLMDLVKISMKVFDELKAKISPEADEINYYRLMLGAIKHYPGFTVLVNEKHKKGELKYYVKLIENAKNKGEIRDSIDSLMLSETIQSLLDGIGFNVFFIDQNRDYDYHIKRGLQFLYDLIKV